MFRVCIAGFRGFNASVISSGDGARVFEVVVICAYGLRLGEEHR